MSVQRGCSVGVARGVCGAGQHGRCSYGFTLLGYGIRAGEREAGASPVGLSRRVQGAFDAMRVTDFGLWSQRACEAQKRLGSASIVALGGA